MVVGSTKTVERFSARLQVCLDRFALFGGQLGKLVLYVDAKRSADFKQSSFIDVEFLGEAVNANLPLVVHGRESSFEAGFFLLPTNALFHGTLEAFFNLLLQFQCERRTVCERFLE